MRTSLTRPRAATLHLALSVAIATCVFLAVRWVWYPGPLFDGAGGRDLFLLIVTVDVVLGPLITLIVFKPGKRGLAFDMAFIAVMQLAALGYGLWSISLSRPVYVVFVKDRFELTRASDIDAAELAKARGTPYEHLPWTGPRYIGVAFPSDPGVQFEIMMSASAGRDINAYPRFFAPYEATAADAAAKAQPLSALKAYNRGREAEIDALPAKYGRAPAELVFLPLKTGKADLAVILAAGTGAVLGLEPLTPWEYR
jgi:hypothetical protein